MVASSPASSLIHRRFSAVAGAFLLLAGLFPAALAAPARTAAVSPNIVISQVYGGGGNSGATLTNDFIELFNRGTSTVDLTGWSVQYTSATGTGNFSATQINGSLAPGHYYLVQEAAGSGGTTALPTPDAAGSLTMSASSGKVIVANTSTALACNGGSTPCSPAQLAQIVDLVGYGTANFYEGAGGAPGLSNTTAAFRAAGGCTDTDNNTGDFSADAPSPRNTASPANVCSSEPASPVINEFSASTTGADVEYVEVYADPSTDLSSLTILEIEGDSNAAMGTIDEVISVGSTDSAGFWLEDLPSNALENGTITLLMVSDFTGALGDDLDTNDDGTLDITPWTDAVDAVAVNDGGAGDLTYGVPVLGPNYDGVSTFAPGGASRIPDGADTDTTADWVRNDFDLAGIPGYPGSIGAGEAYNTPGEPNEAYVPPPTGECGDAATYIHDVQGDGLTSPITGASVVIEGIVVGDFQNNAMEDSGELNGFYVQEEDADADANPATSEGIFVFAPGADDVAVGDRVRVLATVAEFTTSGGSSQTELSGIGGILVCASGVTLPSITDVSLPVSSTSDLEAFEGMLVDFPQALSISEFFNFDRFNEVVLTDGRQYQPTAVAEPGSPEADAVAQANALGRITLDDGRTSQNPPDLRHPDGDPFTLDHLFRGGDTVTDVTGVIDESFGVYRIQPTANASYTEVNPRPAAPEDVGGSLHVASFNVLNYFTTLDNAGPICGPAADQGCRGADNANELARQRAKIVAALTEMNADVVGLIEIENNIGDGPTADLVAGLNDELGAGTYDYIPTGAIGTDAIRVAIIYKPASVSPMGSYAVLDGSVDPRFDDERNRPVLAQSFEETATGGIFTVAVNHLKSKGSACGAPDDDPQQGNCNATRTSAASALVDWLAGDPTDSGDRDVLIMGDLNSYDKEDPIDVILAGSDDATGTTDDFSDLVAAYQGEFAYSYLFDGQLGYLDHALASGTIASQVTGTTVWHINADEPDILDYDTSFKPPAQQDLYAPDAYRSSDHDPVIVGLDLTAYDFGGLLPPIDSGALNEVRAGSTVPVKFSLGGDFGLDVLFETPQVFDCATWPLGDSAAAETPGNSMLSYDSSSDQYVFTWKTARSWKGTCKTLEVTLADGTYVTASFDFAR